MGSPVMRYRCEVGDAERFRDDCFRCKDILDALSPFPSSVSPVTAAIGALFPVACNVTGGNEGIANGFV